MICDLAKTFASSTGIASRLNAKGLGTPKYHLAFDVHYYQNDDLQVWSSYTIYGNGISDPLTTRPGTPYVIHILRTIL